MNTSPHEYTIIETQGVGYFWVCSCSQRGEIKTRRHRAKRGGDIHINCFNSKLDMFPREMRRGSNEEIE